MCSKPSTSLPEGWDPAFRRNRRRSLAFLGLLAAALAAAALAELAAGSYETPLTELARGVFGLAGDPRVNLVVRGSRLPRILTAALAGTGLGLAGCILQAILRNPLASASTLGVSQGATFGAAFAIVVLGLGGGRWAVTGCSFAGSLAVAAVILGLSRFRAVSPEGIVLAGVAISSLFTAATTLIQYFASEVELATLVFWTFGDLSSASGGGLWAMALAAGALLCFGLFHRWDYNALLGGREMAASLGIPVRGLTLASMLLCCVTCSVITAQVGLISFIGLAAPHLVRLAVGGNHVYLLPGSALAGACLLLLGDLVSRTAAAPVILPIGAITSFLGGPLFLYLLFKGKGGGAA